ncbi:MAG: hypothetical protein C4583_03355 [Anaerolineaceae bacterium]|nr:MAG: hypothetical protein C4583_03355 [Anaerolineaceae bacterium]
MSKVTRPSDRAAVVGVVNPDALTATTHDSDWIDASKFERFLAIAMVGTLGESAEFDAKLMQATDASGTGAKDITGKAITQISEDVSPAPNNKQALINLRAEELDIANGFTHFMLRLTVAAATSDGGGLVLGFDPHYGPASDNDLSSVAEIVA